MRILVIEDNVVLANAVERLLSEELGAEVILLHSGHSVTDHMNDDIDVLVTAWDLPDISGLQVMARVREDYQEVPIIVCSDRSYHEALLTAVEAGASDYVLKPFEHKVLLAKVRRALQQVQLYRNRRIR